MLKYISLSLGILLLMGCEVRKRETGGLFSRPSESDTSSSTVFSIGRLPRDSTKAPATTAQPVTEASPLNASQPTSMYEIITPFGNMRVRLYNETPAHRDNFKKLVAEGFYNGTTFHRVIRNFMIQGGDPNSKDNDPYNDGTGGPGYTLPAEFNPARFHKRGALAAARQGDVVNPERRSSGSQFYIVQGRIYTPEELNEMEQYVAAQVRDPNFHFSQTARQSYTTIGGTPALDMQYTVFGEIVDGFDVLDRISAVQTESNDRPKEDIPMSIRPVPTS